MSKTIRRIIMSLILGTSASFVSADSNCEKLMEFASQNATKVPHLPPYIRYVPDVHTACISIGARAGYGQLINGCADPYGKQLVGYCLIILPLSVDGDKIDVDKCHEEAHCKYGSWHPPF